MTPPRPIAKTPTLPTGPSTNRLYRRKKHPRTRLTQAKTPTPATTLSRTARRLRRFRAEPDYWAWAKCGFKGAPYRTLPELKTFLEDHPGQHLWANAALQRHALTLTTPQGTPGSLTGSYQGDALRMLANPGRYLFRWPNSAGKTAVLALTVLWFMDCYPDAALVTTAGTWSQIRDQLWREIPYWYDRADSEDIVIKEIQKTQLVVDGKKWFAIGRAASKEATFEGLHSKNVMVIFDEAKAVPSTIWDAARRILRGTGQEDVRLWWITASTPASPVGPFFDACQDPTWQQLKLSAYETARVGLDEVQTDLEELGEDGPLFWSMDLAEFPIEGADTVIPLSELLQYVEGTPGAEKAQKASQDMDLFGGMDVARFGDAESSLAVAQGGWVRELQTWKGKPLTHSAGMVQNTLSRWGFVPGRIALDDDGVGGGVTDILAEANWAPIPIHNGSAALTPSRYGNWVTEAWFVFRNMLREALVSVPDDKTLINQLAARKYKFSRKGQLLLETKDEMKKAGRVSPDRAEAVIYATAGGILLSYLATSAVSWGVSGENFLD